MPPWSAFWRRKASRSPGGRWRSTGPACEFRRSTGVAKGRGCVAAAATQIGAEAPESAPKGLILTAQRGLPMVRAFAIGGHGFGCDSGPSLHGFHADRHHRQAAGDRRCIAHAYRNLLHRRDRHAAGNRPGIHTRPTVSRPSELTKDGNEARRRRSAPTVSRQWNIDGN